MGCKHNSTSYLAIEILVMYVQRGDSHKEKACKRHFHPSHPLKISPKYDIASYLVIEVLVMYVQKWWQLQSVLKTLSVPSKWTVNITAHLIWLLKFWLCMFNVMTVIKKRCVKDTFTPPTPSKLALNMTLHLIWLLKFWLCMFKSGGSYNQSV